MSESEKSYGPFGPLIGSIDEGTSSARFLLFQVNTSNVIASHQVPLEQITPCEGWVEQDPMRILAVVNECIEKTIKKLIELKGSVSDIVAVGITNQRETTIVWDKVTGKPLYNAILWSDTRSSEVIPKLMEKIPPKYDECFLQPMCGLRLATYFSAVKFVWLYNNSAEVKRACENNRCLFGTVDTWLIWNLTGNHLTDVTNASRTMLMNIETLDWDNYLLNFFNVPRNILPIIKSSAESFGRIKKGPMKKIPITGCIGDQHAALLGQRCIQPGEAKATYGTGCFILYNTGTNYFLNKSLLTTVAYKLGPDEPAYYALEGSVAVAGLGVNWLRQNLGILEDVMDAQKYSEYATDDGSVVMVPAFSGLFAPYWERDARGVICGLSANTNQNHLIKATIESVCFQVRDIINVMTKKCKLKIQKLKVDGGMTANDYFLQLQADLGNFEVVKAEVAESTALGAAMAAQFGCNLGSVTDKCFELEEGKSYNPKMDKDKIRVKYAEWRKALEHSLGWNISDD